ncbi:MAG: Pycsar system effector family protein [Dehalococcoidia bacterium]
MTSAGPLRPGDRAHDGHGHPEHAAHEHLMPQVLRIEHHTRTLERAIQMTWVADAKVSPVLALQASLAAVTVTATSLGPVLRGASVTGAHSAAAWLFLVVYALTSLAGTVIAGSVYFPARSSQRGRSLLYFHDVQRRAFNEYRDASIHLELDAAEDDALRQAYAVATIAERKVRDVRRAFLLSGVTVAAWLPLVILARA